MESSAKSIRGSGTQGSRKIQVHLRIVNSTQLLHCRKLVWMYEYESSTICECQLRNLSRAKKFCPTLISPLPLLSLLLLLVLRLSYPPHRRTHAPGVQLGAHSTPETWTSQQLPAGTDRDNAELIKLSLSSSYCSPRSFVSSGHLAA